MREKIAAIIEVSQFGDVEGLAISERSYIAADAILARIESEGLVLVPREMTEEMQEAGLAIMSKEWMPDLYKLLIEARPGNEG